MHVLQVKPRVSLEPCLWFPSEPQSSRQRTIYSSKELSGGKVFIISIFFETAKGPTCQVSTWLFLLIVPRSWISGSLWRQLPVHFACGHLVLWRCILKDGLSPSWMAYLPHLCIPVPWHAGWQRKCPQMLWKGPYKQRSSVICCGVEHGWFSRIFKVWYPSSSLNRDSILAYIDLWGPLEPSQAVDNLGPLPPRLPWCHPFPWHAATLKLHS